SVSVQQISRVISVPTYPKPTVFSTVEIRSNYKVAHINVNKLCRNRRMYALLGGIWRNQEIKHLFTGMS
ncbi:MAG: hypothetical protein V1754_08025, partial [Pseudomonadota bacterium]